MFLKYINIKIYNSLVISPSKLENQRKSPFLMGKSLIINHQYVNHLTKSGPFPELCLKPETTKVTTNQVCLRNFTIVGSKSAVVG